MLIINEVVRDVLFVKLPQAIKEKLIIKIVSSDGADVMITEYGEGCEDMLKVNTTELKNGTYFIQVLYGGKFSIKTFVKSRI